MNPYIFERATHQLARSDGSQFLIHVCGSRLNDPIILIPGAWQDHTIFLQTPDFEMLSTSRYVIVPELRVEPHDPLAELAKDLRAVLAFVLGDSNNGGEEQRAGLLPGRSWRLIASVGDSRAIHWRRITFYGASRLARIILDVYKEAYGFPARTDVVLAQEELDLIREPQGVSLDPSSRLPALRQNSGWQEAYEAIERYVASLYERHMPGYEHALRALCAFPQQRLSRCSTCLSLLLGTSISPVGSLPRSSSEPNSGASCSGDAKPPERPLSSDESI